MDDWILENRYDIFEFSGALMLGLALIINVGFPNMHWIPAVFIPPLPFLFGMYALAHAKEIEEGREANV